MLEGEPYPSNRDVVENSQRLQQIINENCHSFINIRVVVTVTGTLLCLTTRVCFKDSNFILKYSILGDCFGLKKTCL